MIDIPMSVLFGSSLANDDAQLPLRAARQRPSRKPARERQRTLRATWPSAAIEARYRQEMLRLIDDMAHSVMYWVTAAWRKQEPAVTMAMDDMASAILNRAMRELRKRWYQRFDDMASKLALYFAKSVADRTDEQLRKILREGGMTVEWSMSRAQKDVLAAIVHENVSLIKTIPRAYLNKVEGHVMRSVQTGRDLKSLTDSLNNENYSARKYAAFVALDQNNKASGALQRVRFNEAGVEECVWMHSSAGKTPRPSHVKAGQDKVRFKVSEGWYDPHEKKWIWPGFLIHCRCSARPVIKGFA